MNMKSYILRIKPVKRILYTAYREKRKREYATAFKRRIETIKPRYIPKIQDRKNIVIVVADCLRFKNTSLHEYKRDTTPFLSSLKNSGKGVAAAPWTHPSVASIMTGLYPHNHGAYIHSKVRNFDHPSNMKGIRKKVLTLPEIAALNEYRVYFATSIEVASFPMKGRTPIELYPAEANGDRIITDFFRWLDKSKENFFAYLHLGDTHEPLNPPRKFRSYFGKVEKLPRIERWAFQRIEEQEGPEFERFKENKILLYDNTIRYVDNIFQRVYIELERRNLLEETIVIFTADHGEEFWEHGKLEASNFYDPRGIHGVGHGHNVFNEIIEVPVAIEGLPRKVRIDRRSLIDIFPTILEVWETKLPYSIDGRSLMEKPRRFLLSEATGYGYEKKTLIMKDLKFLYAPSDGVEWLFILSSDEDEQAPIKRSELNLKLRKSLLSILTRDAVRGGS